VVRHLHFSRLFGEMGSGDITVMVSTLIVIASAMALNKLEHLKISCQIEIKIWTCKTGCYRIMEN
jgi:hypothetical protein